jgi:hypothetical protein
MKAVMLGLVLCCVAPAAAPQPKDEDIAKLLFENGRVRVYEVLLQPGQAVPSMHHLDHVSYSVTNARTEITWPDGTRKVYETKSGDAHWVPEDTFAVKNVGTADNLVVVVELKEPPPKAARKK